MKLLSGVVAIPLSAGAAFTQQPGREPPPSLSGAVGAEERDAMMQAYRDYNLHLAFALANGDFVADVRVWIHDPKGRLVWLGLADGPLLFVKLPEGRYRITAELEGDKIGREVTVGTAPGPMHYLHWKTPAGETAG